jgi:hypothetical protein
LINLRKLSGAALTCVLDIMAIIEGLMSRFVQVPDYYIMTLMGA